MPFLKWRSRLGLTKCRICHTSEMSCEMTVAQAEPLMPQPKPKMNTGFSAQFTITEASVAYMAIRGWPEERKTAFSPR